MIASILSKALITDSYIIPSPGLNPKAMNGEFKLEKGKYPDTARFSTDVDLSHAI
jgi:hypothetical protein